MRGYHEKGSQEEALESTFSTKACTIAENNDECKVYYLGNISLQPNDP